MISNPSSAARRVTF